MGTLPAPPGCWGSPEPRRAEPAPSAPSVPPSRLGWEGSWAHSCLTPQNIANRTRNTLFRYSSGGHFSHPIPSLPPILLPIPPYILSHIPPHPLPVWGLSSKEVKTGPKAPRGQNPVHLG